MRYMLNTLNWIIFFLWMTWSKILKWCVTTWQVWENPEFVFTAFFLTSLLKTDHHLLNNIRNPCLHRGCLAPSEVKWQPWNLNPRGAGGTAMERVCGCRAETQTEHHQDNANVRKFKTQCICLHSNNISSAPELNTLIIPDVQENWR